jgi:phenylalanyl-tRNA synthetase beta subunit
MDSLPLCTEIQRPKYVEPGTVHPIDRSLAFTLPGHTNAGDIASYMLSAGPEWLRKVDMLDRYVHDHEGSQVATITFALQFTSETGNRTAEEVNAACAFLIRAVEERFSDQHVTLRA